MPTDSEWLQGVDTADAVLLGDLVDHLRRSLAKGFGRQLSDPDLEDLAQTSMLKILENRSSFEGRSTFITWATAIAVNLAMQLLRKREFVHVSLDDTAAQGAALMAAPRALQRIHTAERDAALARAIEAHLTERQREALLANLAGMPLAEIAERQGTSRGALYKLLHDARKRLRTQLDRQGIAFTVEAS